MRSSRTSIVVAAALLLCACSDAGPRGRRAARPLTDFDALTVEQTACLFNCPVFEVKIFSDGRVRHSGPSFEHTGGAHESRIDDQGLAQIAKALRDARLDEMRDRYSEAADGCELPATDMSTILVSLSRGRGYRNKSVEIYTGCLGPSVPTERINALIKAIDPVTGTGALLEQREQAARMRQRPAGDSLPGPRG
ncbi:DUF6438 domain-containing protein [Massilia sp. IC2-477]|uniref:DUF6438 domain-containing protein n=1 Tax=Massilia sp. IC2-477 TaxID=2887198 RepID=UPI001D119E85|nr:DUF6438 domain-containing protein [Massilia sp. IC2-477]MCC2956316.1 DUF6438 domain-containing protein [Massilia sp. IC2-477]